MTFPLPGKSTPPAPGRQPMAEAASPRRMPRLAMLIALPCALLLPVPALAWTDTCTDQAAADHLKGAARSEFIAQCRARLKAEAKAARQAELARDHNLAHSGVKSSAAPHAPIRHVKHRKPASTS